MLTNHSEAGARNSSVNLITSAAAPPKSEGSSISSSPNGGKKGAIALAPPATRGQRQRVTRAGSQPLSPLIVPSASGRQSNTAGPMTAPTSEGPPLQIASTNTVSASFVVDGVSFSIAKLAVSEDGSEVQCCATVSNTNETPIFDYKLQVAVQKSLKVTLTAASTTTIRPSAEINHNFLVEAMDGNLPEVKRHCSMMRVTLTISLSLPPGFLLFVCFSNSIYFFFRN